MNRLRTMLFACAAFMTLALSVGAGADSKLDISNWKEIIPSAMYTRLVEESIKNLNSYTASPTQFNQNGRRVQAEATNLMVYAEIAQRGGNSNAVGLRKAAEDLLEAAKAKKGDEARKLVATLAGYKKLTGTSSGDFDLAKPTNMKIIMDVSLKEIDRNLTPYKRLNPTSFATKGKAEEVIAAMYKVAAMSVATTAHAPTTDLPAGKTTKDWLSAAEEMRKNSLAAANAASAKKLPELKKAINDLSASCAKCHDDFRMEKN